MNNKNAKKVALTFASAMFAMCMTGIGLTKANAENTAMDSFSMIPGASIRMVEGSTGIRFSAAFNNELYSAVSGDETKEFGMIITKYEYYKEALENNADLVTGLNALGENKYALISESSENPLTPYAYNGGYRIDGALTNISYDHADWSWIGVGVVISNGNTYDYAALNEKSSVRTTAYVASAALADTTEGYTAEHKAIFKNYVYEYAAKVGGVSEADFVATEDKASYLDGATVSVTGVDTTAKYNTSIEGKETYLTIGQANAIGAAVADKDGKALDLFCEVASENADVVAVENGTATAKQNGYTTLTATCSMLEGSGTVTAYTGSEKVVNFNETKIRGWSGAQDGCNSNTETGEIAGQAYYGYTGRKSNGTIQLAAYPDTMSVYYIDYMIAQGYTHVRFPLYFDTSLSNSIYEGVSEADKELVPTIRAQRKLPSESFTDMVVDANEWIYWDIDLTTYRNNFVGADGGSINEYGIKQKIADKWFESTAMVMNLQNSLVYMGEQTFVKDNNFTVNQLTSLPNVGDVVELTTKEGLALSVEGTSAASGNKVLALFKNNNLSINANIYATDCSDTSKKPTIVKSADVNVNVPLANGKDEVVLADVKGLTGDLPLEQYSFAGELAQLGFNVTGQKLVKRYSNGEGVFSVASTERGIFYYTLTVEKDGTTFAPTVSFDIYSSAEPIEYESFGHEDSVYAFKAYYAYTNDGFKNYSYDKLISTYTPAKNNGMEMVPGDGYLAMQGLISETTSLGKTVGGADTVYGADVAAKSYCVSIDQSKINQEGPIAMTSIVNAGKGFIYFYVTPRHTVEYYEMFATSHASAKLKYSYAAGYTSGNITTRWLTKIENGVSTYVARQNASKNWQSAQGKEATVTLSAVIANYDALNSRAFATAVIQDPQGFIYNDVLTANNGVFCLGSIWII